MQQHGLSCRPWVPVSSPFHAGCRDRLFRPAGRPLLPVLLALLLLAPWLLLAPALLLPSPALAASPQAAAPSPQTAAAPASEAEMALYTRIAAVNTCIARAAGVEFDKAVAIAGETIAELLEGHHGGVISVVNSKPLSLDELRQGAINSAVLGAAEICPQQVPKDVLESARQALSQAAPR